MAKKLVVQRNLRKTRGGGAPYLKYLVFSAIGLIFLVGITPYLLRDKSREATQKRPIPESGVVTKELPTQAPMQPALQPANSAATAAPQPEAAGPAVAGAPAGPGSVNPQQPQPTPQAAPGAVTASREPAAPPAQPTPATVGNGSEASRHAAPPVYEPPPAPPEKPVTQAPSAETAQKSPKVLFPKNGSPAEGFPARAERPHAKAVKKTAGMVRRKKTASAAKPVNKSENLHCAKPALGVKPAVGSKPAAGPKAGGSYSVQVGSVFRNMSQAESVQKHLAAKGYRASIRRVACSGFLVVTSPSSKDNAYTLKEQMNAGGVRNARVVAESNK
jgi:hypothetical protein